MSQNRLKYTYSVTYGVQIVVRVVVSPHAGTLFFSEGTMSDRRYCSTENRPTTFPFLRTSAPGQLLHDVPPVALGCIYDYTRLVYYDLTDYSGLIIMSLIGYCPTQRSTGLGSESEHVERGHVLRRRRHGMQRFAPPVAGQYVPPERRARAEPFRGIRRR